MDRNKLLGVKVSEEEMAVLRGAANRSTGKNNLSEWARQTLLDKASPTMPQRPTSRSWSAEWAAMEKMEPTEAAERLRQLAGGRQLPDGFRAWKKERKLAWLDREWPL